jgi:hypothetical protein
VIWLLDTNIAINAPSARCSAIDVGLDVVDSSGQLVPGWCASPRPLWQRHAVAPHWNTGG